MTQANASQRKPTQANASQRKPTQANASHRFGKCSECHEIICVEKAVTDTQSTQPETTEKLYKAFRIHLKLKYSEDFSQAAARIVREATKD